MIPTSAEQEAARRLLTPAPDRDRFWAQAIRAAIKGAAEYGGEFLMFETLCCRDGVLLTEYCMTGCSSNALRRLMAQAERREIPGLYSPPALPKSADRP